MEKRAVLMCDCGAGTYEDLMHHRFDCICHGREHQKAVREKWQRENARELLRPSTKEWILEGKLRPCSIREPHNPHSYCILGDQYACPGVAREGERIEAVDPLYNYTKLRVTVVNIKRRWENFGS